MSCDLCERGSHHCQSYGHHANYAHPHYSDVPDELEEEPEAPTLSLGNRILWLTETRAASGIVRWIGRIPSVSNGWTAGVEFDNVMPNGGNGDYRGRSFFTSRPGHALFLPVSDLLKVDSPPTPSNGERTSFFGRLQDSCSNFAHRKRRDSTFGDFKQEYCPTCNHNDVHHNGHHYNHAPVYDRITSRRSMYFEDQPYEAYNVCVPCGPTNRILNEIPNNRQYGRQPRSHSRDECLSVPNNESRTVVEYPNHDAREYSDLSISRKESIFNPRTSLRFMNGFKEWVSCLLLGTNRRKSSRKLVLKDRKSVTSVFLSNNSQSLTGQRLSSFSEYASISISKGSQKNESSNSKQSGKSLENANHVPELKKKSRKKRPAPLPPIEYKKTSAINGDEQTPKRLSNGSINSVERRDSKKERNKNTKIISKTVKSTSGVSYSVPVQKRYKKRRAPPPPIALSTTNSAIYASVRKKDSRNFQNGAVCKYNDYNLPSVSSKHAKVQRKNSNEWNYPETSKVSRHRKTHKHLKRRPHVSDYDNVKNNRGSESDDSSSGSITFSPEDSSDDKYGLVNYKAMKAIDGIDEDTSMARSSSFVQYSSDNSDVCLKISIQKTETNVVTVEEISAPHTVCYTIEEDTSSSELTDEPPEIPLKMKAIDMLQESKANSTDSSLASTEDSGEKSKTVFDELKMKPPTKGSVKEFVHAFNMLAAKSNGLSVENSVPKQKIVGNGPSDSKSNSIMPSTSKNIQSFPTKWEFQNNKPQNLIYSSNQLLLPIAEESINETSEHDGNIEESNSKILNSKQHKKGILSDQKQEKSTNDTCSHCSEKHSPTSTSKGTKKKIAPKLEHLPHSEKFQLPNSSKASVAALSSLLQEKAEHANKVIPSSSKPDFKPDQPIMVGLYIEDKSSHRGPIPLLVTPSMSLRKLKKQVEAEYNFPSHQQCWILGDSFAVQEDASLSSYGVKEAGCPILLYVMAKDSKSRSLPCRASTFLQPSSSSSEEETPSPRHNRKRKPKSPELRDKDKKESPTKGLKSTEESHNKNSRKKSPSKNHDKQNDTTKRKSKSDYHKAWEEEFTKKTDYRALIALDDVDLVANVEPFECPVCFLDVEANEGIILQDCLHNFCKECLSGAIQYSDTAVIKCPFRNDEYSCESHLQEREIKCLVNPDVYERHLQRSMALAESQAQDSFHCKTPDCPGWCLFEDNVNTFLCPVCHRTNCLTCAAIHEGRNCRQYQDQLALNSDTSEEAKKTKEYLQSMVENGEAMECPKCQVILMKKWGCDWLKCSMCHTEVCWVTKGPRWGPGGKGDTSGGCKCMVNGVRCHPKCSYCH
ncbi:RanBP-type and C3HC4-type zinc like protein [Argiope bruennichi]|uniref:RanBP-type and C3HC4-type zinc like protein n=1 Tax=Argiope bruennichi TaxID=94029 RepID=A0A8T0F8H1_ARGBR|nr:RanBP-type and C3HC4-type zinc like protein [Argiope bruennichi]